MTIGTYGLTRAAPSVRSFGGGLGGMADGQEREATALAGQAAQMEQNRNLGNEQIERQRKAGNAQLGSAVGSIAGGAMAGSAAGPWGMAAGALLGGLAGGQF